MQSTLSSSPPVTAKPSPGNQELQSNTTIDPPRPPPILRDGDGDSIEEQPRVERRAVAEQLRTDDPEPLQTGSLLPISVLWDQAYDELFKSPEATDEMKKYGSILDSTLANQGARQEQMENFVKERTDQIASDEWKVGFKGHEFAVKDFVQPVVSIVGWAKEFVTQAVQVSPQASIAWTGVCLLLPVSVLVELF